MAICADSHASAMVLIPSTTSDSTSTSRAPNRSIAQPTGGDAPVASSPPTAAAPPMSARLHPVSSAISGTKTAKVKLPAAFRTNILLPAAPSTTHP